MAAAALPDRVVSESGSRFKSHATMTGIEVMAVALPAALGTLAGWKKSRDHERAQEAEAKDLFLRFFPDQAWEKLPDSRSTIGRAIPSGLDSHAVQCIKIIERYEEDGQRNMITEKTTKTRILEELKRWLLSVSDGSKDTADIKRRLEYVQQFLLRPDIYGPDVLGVSVPSNAQISFLKTLAQVCSQLDVMHRQAVSSERNGATQLLQITALGRELVELLLPILVLTLPGETGGARLDPGAKPVEIESLATFRDALMNAAVARGGNCVVDVKKSDVGRLLLALVSTAHAANLCASDDEALKHPGFESADEVSGGQGAAASGSQAIVVASAPEPFAEVFRRVEEQWSQETVRASSGLLPDFWTPKQQVTRMAYLQLCWHFDRLLFFLSTLRPCQQLASSAGDIALCHLHACLSHLLQELDGTMLELRQARLETMGRVKRHLQELGRRFSKAAAREKRWMQPLRLVDEPRLDALHRSIVATCSEARNSFPPARAVELESSARRVVQDIADKFKSADYQGRSAIRPDAEMKSLAIAAGPPRALALTAV